MRDGLIRSRKWIYVGLAILALASLFLPTMVLRIADVRTNFWLTDVFSINAWYAVCWCVLWVIPVTVIVINMVRGKGDNAALNTILFAIGILLVFVAYPIIMKLIMLQGAAWNTVSFYLGIGGILSGTFMAIGLILAVWSMVDAELTKKRKTTVK